jgi:O-antigen/teichoic acid export membrane protein
MNRGIVARNTVYFVGTKLIYAAGWIVLTPHVLRALGQEMFGFWSLLMLLGGSLTFFDLGLTSAVTRLTAQLAANGQHGAIPAAVRRATLVYSGFGVVVAGVGITATPLVLAAFRVPATWHDEAATAYALAFAAFGLSTASNVVQGALMGLQRMDLSSSVGLVLAPVLFGGVVVGLSRPQPLVAVLVAQLVWTGLTGVGMVAFLAWVRRRSPRPPETAAAVEGVGLAEMARYGSRIQVGALATFLNSQVDKLLIGAFVGLAWVAPSELGLRVTNGLVSIPQLFLVALMPALSHWDARAQGDGRDRLYSRLFEPYALVVVATGACVLALAGPLVQTWLGTPDPDVVFALRLTMATGTLVLATGVGTTLARAAGRPGLEARMALLALGLHLVLGWLGLSAFGWRGALLGGFVASSIACAWLLTHMDRWLGIHGARASFGALARASVPAAAAAAAAFGLEALWPPGEGRAAGATHLAVGGAVFAIVGGLIVARLFPSMARDLAARLRESRPE